jgi:hypothetical protein
MPEATWTISCLGWSAAGFIVGYVLVLARRPLGRRRR